MSAGGLDDLAVPGITTGNGGGTLSVFGRGSPARRFVSFALASLSIGKRVRRSALQHALLSYFFGTVIVAIAVRSVAALLGR